MMPCRQLTSVGLWTSPCWTWALDGESEKACLGDLHAMHTLSAVNAYTPPGEQALLETHHWHQAAQQVA